MLLCVLVVFNTKQQLPYELRCIYVVVHLIHARKIFCVCGIFQSMVYTSSLQYCNRSDFSPLLGQLGIIVTRGGRAEVLTNLSGNPKAHIESLKRFVPDNKRQLDFFYPARSSSPTLSSFFIYIFFILDHLTSKGTQVFRIC